MIPHAKLLSVVSARLVLHMGRLANHTPRDKVLQAASSTEFGIQPDNVIYALELHDYQSIPEAIGHALMHLLEVDAKVQRDIYNAKRRQLGREQRKAARAAKEEAKAQKQASKRKRRARQ